jgi:alcohol dehydrogenase
VIVRVHAASVNPKDWKLNYNLSRAATLVGPFGRRLGPLFGDDLAGTVVATGKNVHDLGVGDAVYGMDMRLRTASLAEQALISRKRIARMPPGLSFTQAASMPLAALTALQGLRKGHASKGSRVLVIGASGGVGTFAVQIGKALGMHITGVCSGANADFVTQLGADAVIDYTAGDYRQDAGEFDLVFDVTSYETPQTCAALIAPQGWFISTGGQGASMLATPLYRLAGRNADSVVVESYSKDLDTLSGMVERGELRPVVDSVFSLEDAEQAYARNRTGRCRGKVVIAIIAD